MPALFRMEVYTPFRLFFCDDVEAVVLTLIDGETGIYAGHSLMSAPVSPCLLRIRDKNGSWITAFTEEGILEVTHHKTVLMSDTAEWGNEIDRESAIIARDDALLTINSGMLKSEIQNARQALRRAECRLKVWELNNNHA